MRHAKRIAILLICLVTLAASDAPFLVNHDTARAAGFLRRKPELIKTAWGMSLMMSGDACLYYGEELGMSGSGKDENKRAPMQSTDDSGAVGMTVGPPRMEDVSHSFPPADEQQKDIQSILNYIKKAIAIRNQYPAISRGTSRTITDTGEPAIGALEKTYGGGRVVLIYNLSDTEQTVEPTGASSWTAIADCLTAGLAAPAIDGLALTIPAYTIVVMQ